MRQRNSFTLIEILVVTTIISLLMAGGIASYSQFSKQSRDARRKADIEQLRAALEMYRSNSSTSSYPTSLESLVSTYINSVPEDPKTQEKYSYTNLPDGCTENTPCSDYLLETDLEASESVYQTNPYGGVLITNTPAAQPTNTTVPTTPASPTPTTGLGEFPTNTPTPTTEFGGGGPTNTPTPTTVDSGSNPTNTPKP